MIRKTVSFLSATMLGLVAMLSPASPAHAYSDKNCPDGRFCLYSQTYFFGIQFTGRMTTACVSLSGYTMNNHAESAVNHGRRVTVYDWSNCLGPSNGGGWEYPIAASNSTLDVHRPLLPRYVQNDISSYRVTG